jgi:cytoplasmic iron level regulating protein YaaA (DUF328/UPF0246 family)
MINPSSYALAVLILLPPSEGKAAVDAGDPLELAGLSMPRLNPLRERVLNALVRLCTQKTDARARAVLGLSPAQAGEVRRNATLREAPARPAGEVYNGVLYEALDLTSMSPQAVRYAEDTVAVASGLWGAVRLGDRIPPYRCPMVTLPRLGRLATYWRSRTERGGLAAALAEAAGDGPVLDLRSSAYAAAWRPTGDLAGRTLTVRVLHETTVDGVPTRSVVSHFNKATKGRLVRALATAGVRPRTRAELVEALRDLKHQVEERSPGSVDLVVTEI